MKVYEKKEISDFQSFAESIKNSTGIEIGVYSADGSFIVGYGDKTCICLGKTTEKTISVTDCGDRTIFPLRYRNKTFVGAVNGVGKVFTNYAKLITVLAENSFFKETELSLSEFYKEILLGEINYSQLRLYTQKYSVPEVPCFVMVISVSKGVVDDILAVINNYGNDNYFFVVKIDDSTCAFIKFYDKASYEYQSSNEYAEFLAQSVYEETGVEVKICVGSTVKSVYDLSTSYQQASAAARMSKTLASKGNIHSFKEYLLIKMLEDLPKYKLNEYLQLLLDSSAREIFEDSEMTNTAEEFLENSLNVSETSRKLYLHRNTLTYRLDKIEKATGLNVRKFSDAITFRLITVLSKLVK